MVWDGDHNPKYVEMRAKMRIKITPQDKKWEQEILWMVENENKDRKRQLF